MPYLIDHTWQVDDNGKTMRVKGVFRSMDSWEWCKKMWLETCSVVDIQIERCVEISEEEYERGKKD